jgi:phosphohistidine phosphatase
LNGEGAAAFENLLRAPRGRRVRPDLVLTSGLRRATQTARLLVRSGRETPPLRVTRTLEPGRGAEGVLRVLRRHAGVRRVAVVGHEPDLSTLLTHLIGSPPRRPLPKGAICCVRLARIGAGAGRVAWTLTPRIP